MEALYVGMFKSVYTLAPPEVPDHPSTIRAELNMHGYGK